LAISYSDVVEALQEARSHLASNLTAEATTIIDHYVGLIRRNIVPDPDLIEHCRRLYARHRYALDLVFKYGVENAFVSAANQFLESHNDLKKLEPRSAQAAFLPASLWEIVPEMEKLDWWGQSRPMLFWFNLSDDRLTVFIIREIRAKY
jgi:hypothetical protein